MMNHAVSSFLSGCALNTNLLFAAKQVDSLAADDVPNSSFFLCRDGNWSKYKTNVGWPAIAMGLARPPGRSGIVVGLSPYGDFWEVEPASNSEITGSIDVDKRAIRALSTVDNVVYGCGMGRLVIRRDGPGVWVTIGPQDTGATGNEVIGFEDIDGFSHDDLYAVGWQGEIWRSIQANWSAIDSPVSANLNAVSCAADGYVYIVGDDGVLMRGRADAWSILDSGRTENLMDVYFHGGTVYVVSDFRIFRLVDDTLVVDDDFSDPDDRPATCLYLLGASDGLISMGPKDLFRKTGTGSWVRMV